MPARWGRRSSVGRKPVLVEAGAGDDPFEPPAPPASAADVN